MEPGIAYVHSNTVRRATRPGARRVRPLAPPADANGSFPTGVFGKFPSPRASGLRELEHDELTIRTPESLSRREE
jgi:hypothetical protein